jgi:hypothetical protein
MAVENRLPSNETSRTVSDGRRIGRCGARVHKGVIGIFSEKITPWIGSAHSLSNVKAWLRRLAINPLPTSDFQMIDIAGSGLGMKSRLPIDDHGVWLDTGVDGRSSFQSCLKWWVGLLSTPSVFQSGLRLR